MCTRIVTIEVKFVWARESAITPYQVRGETKSKAQPNKTQRDDPNIQQRT